MTTGQLIFYSGVALLGLTVILAIIFIIKKPKYIPESAVYDSMASGKTQRLRNGYPTDHLTVRRKSVKQPSPETAVLSEKKEPIMDITEKLFVTTAKLPDTTALDTQETEKLTEQLHHPSEDATVLLQEQSRSQTTGTARLDPDSTERLDDSFPSDSGTAAFP